MPDSPHQKDNAPILGDEITTYNGASTPTDSVGLHPVAQLIELGLRVGDGVAVDVSDTNGLPIKEAGVFGYAAGTAPVTVTTPSGAHIRRVSVVPNTDGATVQIAGGAIITVPGDADFNEQIPGICTGNVAIAGAVRSYYVSWVI